jgi:hypothetical protein
MRSADKARLFLIRLAAIFLAVAGYLMFLHEGQCSPPAGARPSAQAGSAASKPSKPALKSVNWSSLIPAIRAVLKRGPTDGDVEAHYPIRIVKEADLTGDGVPEALVYTGDGGAYTDYLVLMRLKDGQPIEARFRDASGKTIDPSFLQGASVMHGVSAVMVPEEKAIYLGAYDMNSDATAFASCGARAYRWNMKSETFDWDSALSEKFTQEFCEREREQLLPPEKKGAHGRGGQSLCQGFGAIPDGQRLDSVPARPGAAARARPQDHRVPRPRKQPERPQVADVG